ncbi:MAG: hypothetical protein PHI67_10245, partial [Candidatus Methanomethylophilaceae archaeon]|nr:hypothetical protein [Candidatus Methanomethylophilaceae archaeon]
NQNPRGVVPENLPLIRTKNEHPAFIGGTSPRLNSRLARMVRATVPPGVLRDVIFPFHSVGRVIVFEQGAEDV